MDIKITNTSMIMTSMLAGGLLGMYEMTRNFTHVGNTLHGLTGRAYNEQLTAVLFKGFIAGALTLSSLNILLLDWLGGKSGHVYYFIGLRLIYSRG